MNKSMRPDAAGKSTSTPARRFPEPDRGQRVLLERLEGQGGETEVLTVLAEHYEVTAAPGGEGRRFEVFVDDAIDPDEAVVRLASVLDAIDREWEQRFAWPRARA